MILQAGTVVKLVQAALIVIIIGGIALNCILEARRR
jgi:hypothetical protein